MAIKNSGQRIVVDIEYLRDLERRCVEVTQELRSLRYAPEPLSSAPQVARAMGKFESRWDQSREQIGEGLRALSQALQIIGDNFEEADRQLGASLSEEEGQ